jgi:glycosyltransferase involved in cell wall biosynthesis
MKILFIHNQYQRPGGEDIAVELESNLLRDRGHEVKLVIFQNKTPAGFFQRIKMGGKSIYSFSSRKRLKEEILSFKPDLIHVHNLFFEASPSVLSAAKSLDVPVVLTLHNYRLICANALLLRDHKPCELCVDNIFPLSGIKYRCYRDSMAASALVTTITATHKLLGTWRHKVNRFIVLTEFAKSRFIDSSLRVHKNQLFVKPNFLPDPGAAGHDREDFFLFVGRLSAEKGINTLLDTFTGSPKRLVVIGDGPDRRIIEARFLDENRVTFKGWVSKEEVLSYMSRCKALIFPSVWYEGLPFVIIEAFATGTPVIASNLGSMTELIEEGNNGFLFEPGNSHDLKTKIELFLHLDEKERRQMSENARATYLNKYHPEIHYQTILSLYERVIGEKSVPDV